MKFFFSDAAQFSIFFEIFGNLIKIIFDCWVIQLFATLSLFYNIEKSQKKCWKNIFKNIWQRRIHRESQNIFHSILTNIIHLYSIFMCKNNVKKMKKFIKKVHTGVHKKWIEKKEILHNYSQFLSLIEFYFLYFSF